MSEETETTAPETPSEPEGRADAWTNLALTLPIFLVYHLSVVFQSERNAADPVTMRLRAIANASIPSYVLFTLLLGGAFVGAVMLFGKRRAFSVTRFLIVAGEGLAYAAVLRLSANYLLGALPLSAPIQVQGGAEESTAWSGVVMSLGAGFYEEIAFRVILFGVGAWIIGAIFDGGLTGPVLKVIWAAATAVLFSAWHYTGALGDTFDMRSFAYRAICGFLLTMVFAFRGFAPAVWTHSLYDVWALALR